MNRKFFVGAVLALSFVTPIAHAETLVASESQTRFLSVARLNVWTQQALSEQPLEGNEAIKALRTAGPEGLEVLVSSHAALLERALKLSPQERAGHPEWKRLKNALDQVGAQCDNWAAKLFWHTDLEAAKTQAQKEGKP